MNTRRTIYSDPPAAGKDRWKMTNDECQMTKGARIPKCPNSDFGFRHSFIIRHSSFVIVSRCRAFTLIEVTLALAVSAIILAAVGGVFYSAVRLRERTMAMMDEAAPLQQTVGLLRRDLKGAVPPGGAIAGFLQSVVVSGNLSQNDGIEIYTTTATLGENAPWGDIQKVTYQLQDSTTGPRSAGRDLIRSVTRNVISTTTEESEDQWLMGNVQDLQFAYFDGVDWRDSWDTTIGGTNLPTAVRVRLQLATDQSGVNRASDPIDMVFPLICQSRTNLTQTAGGSQ
jgi:type II secretion system protein J